MRGEVRPTLIDGLEIGFFRTCNWAVMGEMYDLKVSLMHFLSQDNYGANTGKMTIPRARNQLAGIDLRWKVLDLPVALYGRLLEKMKTIFFPILFFQYGIEGWKDLGGSTLRVFTEYADLTSYWWTGDPSTRKLPTGITFMARVTATGGVPSVTGRIRTPKFLAWWIIAEEGWYRLGCNLAYRRIKCRTTPKRPASQGGLAVVAFPMA